MLAIFKFTTVSVPLFSFALAWLSSALCVQKQKSSTEAAFTANLHSSFFPIFFSN